MMWFRWNWIVPYTFLSSSEFNFSRFISWGKCLTLALHEESDIHKINGDDDDSFVMEGRALADFIIYSLHDIMNFERSFSDATFGELEWRPSNVGVFSLLH